MTWHLSLILIYICTSTSQPTIQISLFGIYSISVTNSSTLQKIPAPNFIEFYNGSTILSDCTELKLSSAFENLSGEPKLELTVTVLNVNEGHNAELMQHCSTLKEYAQYVARVRHYAANMSLNQAVECAVDECIKEGILAEFLSKNRAEVISVKNPDMKPDFPKDKTMLQLKLPEGCCNRTNLR